ncbi:GNAT family N-acetyltransferase [Enterococcus asini]|uniref:GNAT family N-acetyltransferase n=1 Tax=Enterococcus asini TaxID=57732 RepID=UPI00266BC568|nr:GNAT family N-acetyltransferase [Enterococcus asini]
MEFMAIQYGSAAYQQTLALRNRVMRKPLGLSIATEDFSHEAGAFILGAFEKEDLLGVAVLSLDTIKQVAMLEYLCVDNEKQSQGVGQALLEKMEAYGAEQGMEKMTLEARVSAQAFYEKNGYQIVGESYLLEVAPVPHILMTKSLVESSKVKDR